MEWKNLPDTSTPITAENLNNINEYSTNEIVVGKFDENKLLYRKMFKITKNLTKGVNQIPHNITNLDRIYKFDMLAQSYVLPYIYSYNGDRTNLQFVGFYRYTDTNLEIVSSEEWSSREWTIIVEYTKNN